MAQNGLNVDFIYGPEMDLTPSLSLFFTSQRVVSFAKRSGYLYRSEHFQKSWTKVSLHHLDENLLASKPAKRSQDEQHYIGILCRVVQIHWNASDNAHWMQACLSTVSKVSTGPKQQFQSTGNKSLPLVEAQGDKSSCETGRLHGRIAEPRWAKHH